jgi:GT2 family glycosyltransferase
MSAHSAPPLRIAVACATHGRRACLERLFESVAALDPAPALVVCVVQADNDGSAAMLRERFPFVRVVELLENRGVWGGFNAAWEAALEIAPELDAIAMIDDDAWFLGTNALATVAEAFRAHPFAGAIQARIVEDGRADEGDAPYLRAEWTGGANALRREAWEAVGPYPAWMFRSAGETLLAHRLLDAGMGCLYLPTWRLAHMPEKSGRDPVAFHDFSIRNRYLVAAMIGSPFGWPCYWIGHFARSIARRLSGKPGRPFAALAGAFRLLPRALAERGRRPVSGGARRLYRRLRAERVEPAVAAEIGLRGKA